MTFTEAAARQHLYASFYTVWLVGPDGSRREVTYTAKRSGANLLKILRRPEVQEMVASLPGAAGATLTKHADRLEFSNGWKLAFGGTIRQEAARG